MGRGGVLGDVWLIVLPCGWAGFGIGSGSPVTLLVYLGQAQAGARLQGLPRFAFGCGGSGFFDLYVLWAGSHGVDAQFLSL